MALLLMLLVMLVVLVMLLVVVRLPRLEAPVPEGGSNIRMITLFIRITEGG